MNNIVIRELTFKDINGVRIIDVLTQKEYLGEQWDLLSDEEKETFLKSRKSEFMLNCKTGYSFVANKDSCIVGFLFAYENVPYKDEIFIRYST